MRLSRMLLAVLAACALVAGFMPTAHADDSTATYIVELKDGLSPQALIPGLLGTDAKILTKAISGGIGTLTAAQAAALESNPSVKSVRLDTKISTKAPQPKPASATVSAASLQTGAPWNLDILDSNNATMDGTYNSANGGNGVNVYVVDTGINRSHTEFSNITVAAGYDFVDGDTNPADCDGQGTAVASLIAGKTYGASKGVTIVPLRVLDCLGSGYASDLISALDYVLANHGSTPSVVDIGLGMTQTILADLDTAVQNVIAAGVTVVVAADFQNADACNSSPGRVPGAITVSASNQSNGEAAGTSFGTCIDLYAPGDNVSFADYQGNSGMATGSGTAYSAALTAGVAAQVLHANPTWSPAQVWAKISSKATANKLTIASAHSTTPNLLLSLGNTYESFVKASYQDFLNRQPSSSEATTQGNALRTGSMSTGSYLNSLSTSDEWLSAIVTKMYQDTLHRGPDPAGLTGWVTALRTHQWTVAQVASFFYASDEYYKNSAGSSASAWVTLLYQKLLNRNPDPLGLAQWVVQTNQNGRSWVAYNFYQSTESRQKRVEALYVTLLFREPDPTGWPVWTQTVLTTGDLVLATQIAGSGEYWEKAWARY